MKKEKEMKGGRKQSPRGADLKIIPVVAGEEEEEIVTWKWLGGWVMGYVLKMSIYIMYFIRSIQLQWTNPFFLIYRIKM